MNIWVELIPYVQGCLNPFGRSGPCVIVVVLNTVYVNTVKVWSGRGQAEFFPKKILWGVKSKF